MTRANVMQRLELQLEGDLTGRPADETVTFAIEGRAHDSTWLTIMGSQQAHSSYLQVRGW
jgi:hypothetical protein